MQKPASSSYINKTLFPAMRLGRALLFIDGCELGIIGEPLAFPNPKLFSPPEVAMASNCNKIPLAVTLYQFVLMEVAWVP